MVNQVLHDALLRPLPDVGSGDRWQDFVEHPKHRKFPTRAEGAQEIALAHA
jgi:hypothetical protein